MKDQIALLIELQEIDTSSARISKTLADVDGKIAALSQTMVQSEAAIQNGQKEIDVLQKQYRSLEGDVALNLSKIRKSRDKLRSVKTNKEYQSLLKEIDDYKALNDRLEDEMLEHLERIETIDGEQQQRKAVWRERKTQVEDEKKRIEQEADAGRGRLERLKLQRQRVSRDVSPEILALFEKVRRLVGLITIVPVKDGVCQGCHLNIPPQTYNELQRCEKLMFCPHCQRIMYSQTHTIG